MNVRRMPVNDSCANFFCRPCCIAHQSKVQVAMLLHRHVFSGMVHCLRFSGIACTSDLQRTQETST